MDSILDPWRHDREITGAIRLRETIEEMVDTSRYHKHGNACAVVVMDVRLPRSLRRFTREDVHDSVARALDFHDQVDSYSVPDQMDDPRFTMPYRWSGWITISVTATAPQRV